MNSSIPASPGTTAPDPGWGAEHAFGSSSFCSRADPPASTQGEPSVGKVERSLTLKLVAFACGLLFALGLGLSGMAQPAKVLAFLDVTGAWDPALLFVMGAAVAVHMPFALPPRSTVRPKLQPYWSVAPASVGVLPAGGPARFDVGPTATPGRKVDGRLLGGAVLFGIGWGASGYCPGPALVSLLTFSPGSLAFVAAMAAGMLLHARWSNRRTRVAAPRSARGRGNEA